ncbi:hypothetical protein DUNSADRAFT_7208 [Dunaliella salina]|uniref:J domain-containing protein n=1 Tax=Dunaliella salina TaxID=3046 RepID=A0ABQ7GLR7_DUNSA|nr:hypothetical protein DUNSADRAFT_7208 [Dunaliella salina]|eukprot:KAF5835555.1 hypothetical protein DUNSADRAFT_7208 [Dunaliella salina]
MSEANKEDAAKCIAIARQALSQKDFAKADKFAAKAQKLYPGDEVERLILHISITKSGTEAQERAQQQGSYANGNAHATGAGQRRAAGGSSTAQGGGQRTSNPQGVPPLRQRKPQQEPPPPPTPDPLALQLHPDKNSAHHADEAFKAVGRSFACLSDPDKARARKALYAGRLPTPQKPTSECSEPQQGGMPGARMYTHRQTRPRPSASAADRARTANAASAAADDSSRMFINFIQIMPVLLLIMFSWLSSSSKPGFSLTQDRTNFPDAMTTARLDVPFYVSSATAFEASYPRGSTSRIHMEGKIEQAYMERLQYKCNQEKMARHRGYTFGGSRGRVSSELLNRNRCTLPHSFNKGITAPQSLKGI